jgi:hypothetical protein
MNNFQALVVAAISWSICIGGCKDEKASSSAMVHQQAAGDSAASSKQPAQEPLQEFRGILLKGHGAKSLEAWNATTHEYYVLEMRKVDPSHPVRRLMLRESDQVPLAKIKAFADKQVVIKARYVEHAIEQREIDLVLQRPIFPALDANAKPKLDSNGNQRWETPSTRSGYAVESIEEDAAR